VNASCEPKAVICGVTDNLCVCLPRSSSQRAPCLKKRRSGFIKGSAQVEKIPIVDMHALPGIGTTPRGRDGRHDDRLDPLRTRTTNPEWLAAFKALYGYPYSIFRRSIYVGSTRKTMSCANSGQGISSKMLDKVGIQVSVANRVAMDYLENNPRFRFVFFGRSVYVPVRQQDLTINPDVRCFSPSGKGLAPLFGAVLASGVACRPCRL